MKSKLITVIILLVLIGSCEKPQPISINSQILLEDVQILASDSMQGRAFSTPGSIKAQKYIEKKFKNIGLQALKNNNYVETFDYVFKGKKRQEVFPIKKPNKDFSNIPDTTATGANIIGFLKGKQIKKLL